MSPDANNVKPVISKPIGPVINLTPDNASFNTFAKPPKPPLTKFNGLIIVRKPLPNPPTATFVAPTGFLIAVTALPNTLAPNPPAAPAAANPSIAVAAAPNTATKPDNANATGAMTTGIPISATTNSLTLSGAFDKALITGVKAFIIATKAGAKAEPIERPKANSSFLNN